MGELGAQSVPSLQSGRIDFVVMGDFHQSIVGETTALTNVPFDSYVPTSLRPPAEVLGSGLVNRYALWLSREYAQAGWHEVLVGDYVDASRTSEWAFFKSQTPFLPLSAPGNHEGGLNGSSFDTDKPHGLVGLLETRDEDQATFLTHHEWIADYLTERHGQAVFFEASASTSVDPTQTDRFDQFWQQMPNGDYVCAVHSTQNKNFSAGASFLLQAKKLTDSTGGRPAYLILCDASDVTESLPSNASIGMISSLQKALIELFLNKMQQEENSPLFFLSGHMAPHEQSKKNWEQVGLDDVYSRTDVFPLGFYANGHHRDITDETAGGRVRRDSPVLSVMTPAIIDAPNEFMMISVAWDHGTQTYVATQTYHSLFPDESQFDEDIVQGVHEFDETLSHCHYNTYSGLSRRPLPTAINILMRKKVLERDAARVQLAFIREDIAYIEKYLAYLKTDEVNGMVTQEFVRSVQDHLDKLKVACADTSLTAPSPAALEHVQALQQLISETPFDAKAAQFMILLAKVASEGEGVPGVRHGLEFARPDPVSGRNVFHWNPAEDTVTYTNQD